MHPDRAGRGRPQPQPTNPPASSPARPDPAADPIEGIPPRTPATRAPPPPARDTPAPPKWPGPGRARSRRPRPRRSIRRACGEPLDSSRRTGPRRPAHSTSRKRPHPRAAPPGVSPPAICSSTAPRERGTSSSARAIWPHIAASPRKRAAQAAAKSLTADRTETGASEAAPTEGMESCSDRAAEARSASWARHQRANPLKPSAGSSTASLTSLARMRAASPPRRRRGVRAESRCG